MIWWSRGLTASGLTGFKAYRLIAFLIFFCPKYLGRNHWALTLFHSASICVAFISRISLVNPVSTVAFISSRFLPRADTSRYSSRVSLNEDAVSNPGVSSGVLFGQCPLSFGNPCVWGAYPYLSVVWEIRITSAELCSASR